MCDDETFMPSCAAGYLVNITDAAYGRFLGRCATMNFGYIGCSMDVTSRVQFWCSGSDSCLVPVSDLLASITNKTCPEDLKGSLKVNYTCVPGKVSDFLSVLENSESKWSSALILYIAYIYTCNL